MICFYLYWRPQTVTIYFFLLKKELLVTWNYGNLNFLPAGKVLFGIRKASKILSVSLSKLSLLWSTGVTYLLCVSEWAAGGNAGELLWESQQRWRQMIQQEDGELVPGGLSSGPCPLHISVTGRWERGRSMPEICQKVIQDDPLNFWLQSQVIPRRSCSCQGSTELTGPRCWPLMTKRLSPLLNRGCSSFCSSSRGYLGSRAISMVCRHGGREKGCSRRWLIPSRLEGLCLELLLSADCEISVIFCTTPALKSPRSCRGRRVSPLPQGPVRCKEISPLMPQCTAVLLEGGSFISMNEMKLLQHL